MVDLIYTGPGNFWAVRVEGKVVFSGDYRDAFYYYEYHTMFPGGD